MKALETFAGANFPRVENTMASGLNMREKFFQIINNGRKFLLALKDFAHANLPRVGDRTNENLISTSSSATSTTMDFVPVVPPAAQSPPASGNTNTIFAASATSNSVANMDNICMAKP